MNTLQSFSPIKGVNSEGGGGSTAGNGALSHLKMCENPNRLFICSFLYWLHYATYCAIQ